MTQETLDKVFRENGFADAVMNDIRRGITFSTGHGLSFERLVNELRAQHSLEEVDQYDALFGVYMMYMTMATPLARHQVLYDMTCFRLENTQLRIVLAGFDDAAREMNRHSLMGLTRSYLEIMT